jgi:alpha-beta hydrolase superfamily lysophospholipase
MKRVPCHFAGGLFGFYHPPIGTSRRCAVILAAPIGTDFTRADRPYRHLAEDLAAQGFPALRFDPRGCGDSSGDLSDEKLVRRWIADLGHAREWIVRESGASQIAIVGLRIAATVAATFASESGAVDSLVLWNPCMSGRAFRTEVVKLHKLYARMEPHFIFHPLPDGDEEALGLPIPASLAAGLDELDLFSLTKKPAAQALVIDGGNFRDRDRLLDHLRSLGTDTVCQPHPAQKFLVTVSHRGTLPAAVLASIVRFLDEKHPARGEISTRATISENASDRPIDFGDDHPLFGILNRAAPDSRRQGRPAIVLANAGTVNRSGPHRLYAQMARRWSAVGFDVLRIDLSGIGDSPTFGAEENLCYPPTGIGDLQDAMTWLAGEKIADRFVIAGLCSGGDLAFQTALRDPRVAGAVILNPRTFCVLDLQSVEAEHGEPPSATVENVPRALRKIADNGIETLLVVSERDPGVHYVDTHFAADTAALAGVRGFSRVDLPGADHTFTALWAQARVGDLVAEHLIQKHR